MKVSINGIIQDLKLDQGITETQLIILIDLIQKYYRQYEIKLNKISDAMYIISVRNEKDILGELIDRRIESELHVYSIIKEIINKLNSIKQYYDLSKIDVNKVYEFKFGSRGRVRYNMSEDIEEELSKTYETADVTYVLIGKYRIKISIRDIKIEFVYKYDRLSTFDYNIQNIENIINSCIVGIERRRKKC